MNQTEPSMTVECRSAPIEKAVSGPHAAPESLARGDSRFKASARESIVAQRNDVRLVAMMKQTLTNATCARLRRAPAIHAAIRYAETIVMKMENAVR